MRPPSIDMDDNDPFEAQYEPLSPTSSIATADVGDVAWGSIDFEGLLYTDDALQEIVASFRAAVVAALQGKDFAEAHAKSEEMARFLRDYIRRCMGAEHVCCDAEDYEQAGHIAKAIKVARDAKKETGEKGGLAFGAVRRIQELLSKYRRTCDTTRMEMKKAGESRNYTKAIALQHELETNKADYAVKLCSHMDRILEMGNLRALWTACQSIEESNPELQPDITADPSSADENGRMLLVTVPPPALQRPRPVKQPVGVVPPPGSQTCKLKAALPQDKIDEMAMRLSVPKRTMEEKASNETNADVKRKNTFMLQEEYDNCTFRPTTQYPSSAITKPSISMPHGHFYPTNTHTRRNPSPHGKARYEGDLNCDPGGEQQEQSCVLYVAKSLMPSIWSQSDCQNYDRINKDQLERLIRIALDDPQQIEAWSMTEGEVGVLRKLRGKELVFQLTDDLRSKAFLDRISQQLQNQIRLDARAKEQAQLDQQVSQGKIARISNIKEGPYKQLVEGIETPGRLKRRESDEARVRNSGPGKMSLEQCTALVSQQLGCRDEEADDRLETLLEDKQSVMTLLKSDESEVNKLALLRGDARMRCVSFATLYSRYYSQLWHRYSLAGGRYAYQLAKRAKFISRMDAYNHKTRSVHARN